MKKTNYFAKNTTKTKNPIKKLERRKKNRSAREKKFVYLLICENNNKTKQKLLLSLSILVVF